MKDKNFWKRGYKALWPEASARENNVLNLLKSYGIQAEFSGFGTGSDQFINGSPDEYGFTKGDPDIHVCNTQIYIEVTGTAAPSVKEKDPLWIRPDKIENASSSSNDVWVVHVLDNQQLMRCIHLTKDTCESLLKRPRKQKTIRGNKEVYIEVGAYEELVRPFDELIVYIKNSLSNAVKQV